MHIYLVGGAVRDRLLGLTPDEMDWVITGSTVQEMLGLGYRPVDPAIPVFLHPQTGDEYALARRERKSGQGYKGFEFDADPGVTLEEDLGRRDLTINAMAQDETGHLVDPYGGRVDLADRRLRHVTPAFEEDPLRVLRLARFAAQLSRFGFTVDDGTACLARRMSAGSDLMTLTTTRLWREMEKSLSSDDPGRYLDELADFGALPRLLPWLASAHDAVAGIPSPAQALTSAAGLSPEPGVRLAAASLSAATTGASGVPPDDWPLPKEIRDTVLACLRHPLPLCSDPVAVLTWLGGIDAWRRAERLDRALLAWSAAVPDRAEDIALLRRAQAATRGARPPPGAPDPRQAVQQIRLDALAGVLSGQTGASS